MEKGMTLVEIMVTLTIMLLVVGIGPSVMTNMSRFWRLTSARANVQKNARISLDIINRNLREATASSVIISQRSGQPPYSWITFSIDKGEGDALGDYGVYQEGKHLYYMKNGSTGTLAENLRFVAFTYPRTDNSGIISVSMTFEEDTFAGHTKALQLSIEKVRVMN
ncbi:MAG: hypothetical protein A3A86_08630 [Elusimicrobia bacterium RIFCSPLOWO2_01_FULL_60_11]|nr:MAG: hypothetical protein A3A86_08630 [Elusimicrobia bacterium RIFCSPLOWO2_01_FULL_60_11]